MLFSPFSKLFQTPSDSSNPDNFLIPRVKGQRENPVYSLLPSLLASILMVYLQTNNMHFSQPTFINGLILWISISTAYHTSALVPPKLCTPETPKSMHTLSSTPAGRRSLKPARPTTMKLGFRLAGPIFLLGPLPTSKSKPSIFKSRSASSNNLLNPTLMFFRIVLNGRRHCSTRMPKSLRWVCNCHYLTLVQSKYWLPVFSHVNGLKEIGIMTLSPRSNGYRNLVHFSSSLHPSTEPIQVLVSNIQKTRSVLILILSSFRQCLVRLFALDGRRLHLRLESIRLLWFVNNLLRTLVFAQVLTMITTSPEPTQRHFANSLKLRSGLILADKIDYKLCVEFLNLYGRGLHMREDPPVLLRFCTNSLRILMLASGMILISPKFLKNYGFLDRNSNCRRFDDSPGVFLVFNHPSTILANYFNHHLIAITINFWILEDLARSKEDSKLVCVLEQPSPDYKTIISQVMAYALPHVAILVPASFTAMVTLSTSFSLLTMTNLSTIELLLEDRSTNLDLTCVKSLLSLCLKALLDSLPTFIIYLCMALGNAFYIYVLKLWIFESFDMYLDL